MEKYKKITYIGISAVLILGASYLFFKYALSIILPFLLSFSVALISRPIINRLCKNTRMNRSLVSVTVMFLILFLFSYLVFIASSAAITQLGNIINSVSIHLEKEENFITEFFRIIDSLKLRFPFLDSNILGGEESVYSIAVGMLSSGIKDMGGRLTSFLASIVASLPGIFITAGVVILSLFYFSKDYDKICLYVRGMIPSSSHGVIMDVKNDILSVLAKFLKSYVILLLLTFLELFIGLLILRVENAFVLSALISVVDLLPVLGVGTVLIPWSAILFISGNTSLAMGILVLYVAVYFLRQIEEPRIMGKQMNVHPLFALFTVYAGLKLGGIGGMIIGPLVAFVIKTLYDSFKNKKVIEKGENV